MAMEMSCLTSVDEDDKDADSELTPLTLLQEPVRMAQESTSCPDSYVKASLKQNTVLDVLSNADMLSPVGLANGPSLHQATQAHELNSIFSEREEEKSITQLKTVQEIDTAGIWGFDVESPENSLDNFDSTSDLSWDPQREFMQFLWENHNDSPGEEHKEEVSHGKSQRTRKRKMDMVVMVDPSENLCPDLSSTSSDESSDTEAQVDSSPVRKVRNSPKISKPPSSPTEKASNYPNGTTKAIKEILYKAPARNSHDSSVSRGISPLKGMLTINSQSEGKPSSYPCPKCNLSFKKEHRLLHHMKSHVDLPSISTKPFTCRDCGQSFKHSAELIDHMSVHQERKTRLSGEIKGMNDKKKQDKNAKFFCPQCPFGTDCPNTFVQHAKTHEKDKRRFRCDKCSFRTLSENDLRRHNIMQHTVITVKKQIKSSATETFPCNICSYKAFGKHVFENHLMLRHQLTLEEYTATEMSEAESQVPTFKAPEHTEFTSKISIKDQISSKRTCSSDEPGDIADLFKNSKVKRGPKPQLAESKLDKSINVLLSRQNHGKKAAEPKKESNNYSPNAQGSRSGKDNYESPKMFAVKVEDSTKSKNGPKLIVDHSPVKKSQSKRKMSTPYRNTSDQDSCFILPKPLPSPKKVNLEEVADCDEKDIYQVKHPDGSSHLCDNSIKKEKKHIIYTYSRRMSIRGALQASKRLFEKIKNEEQEQNNPEIKEECIETEVFQETFESHQIPLGESLTDDLSELESGHKNCPYCPAVFESGVGLSNHIRGHLHRVGLSYNARHVVPPEQVASQDRRPRIRRKISAFRRLKKALQVESDSETVKGVHSCPLCGDAFDNRTGQSNHIRGHLKKLGKSCATKTKTPLMLLRELMRDKRECQRALQILGRRGNHFYYSVSPKLPTANRFTSSQTGFPKSSPVPSIYSDAKPLMPTFSLAEVGSEKGQLESKPDVKNSLTGTTALIGILKKRKCQEDARVKGPSQVARNILNVSSNTENSSGSRVASSLPNLGSEKGEFNRKVCIHCNATFHSGVSLSNHLRAYAKRKRIALLEGTTIGCKAVRQRSRPGSKKKTLPLPQTPEEMYRLTCRFCDLVFQGPLSVQEDWIKHLQRHIMNTGVPHTGLGMVEVTSLPADPSSLQTDQDGSSTVTHAAS